MISGKIKTLFPPYFLNKTTLVEKKGFYKVLSIAKTITTIEVKLQESKETIRKTMLLTDKHPTIAPLFEPGFWGKFN